MSDNDNIESAPRFEAGCGFLSTPDLEAALAGRLPAERLEAFGAHVDAGCPLCVTLIADIETFRRLLSAGPLEDDRREADRQADALQARLREAIRRRTPRST